MSASNVNMRLETFCDGVFAIAITLLILDIKVPPIEQVHSVSDVWHNVGQLWTSFFALSLSFIIILIAWVGHHNLLKAADKTSSHFQFANGFFLFTVILFPFTTAFMAEYLNTPFAQPAIVVYCLNGILHNVGWNLLYTSMLKPKPLVKSTISVEYIQKNAMGARYGLILYPAIAILSWWLPYIALTISVLIWVYWLYVSINIKGEE